MSAESFPGFFSVSSKDIEFAEKVWGSFPDDWVYLYSKTGEEAVHMWEEISEQELPKAKVFVIFWSKSYLEAGGCIREIEQAVPLIENKVLRPVVIRLDDCPLSWSSEFPVATKKVFTALRHALDYRASSECTTVDHAVEIITRVFEQRLEADHPRLPRPELLQSMRSSAGLADDRFRFHPAIWVSGFIGVGRETVIRDYNRHFLPNGRGVTIEVNEATLPKQMLLRIESEGLGASFESLERTRKRKIENETQAVAAAIESVVERGNYVILRHGRIVEERIDLPEWLDEVINTLEPTTRTKLFVISQLPLQQDRRMRCLGAMVTQRIPTIDEHVLRQYCFQLIGHFDREPDRWSDEDVGLVVSASSGSIGFLVSLVRAAANIDDLETLHSLISTKGAPIVEQMTVFARWAFAQLAGRSDEERTLVFLNDVSPCDVEDLNRVVKPRTHMLRVLGTLLGMGLVERETDNLYRLTPLLSTRLNRELIRPDLLDWQRKALLEFAQNPAEFEAPDHEFLRIESRIQAGLVSGGLKMPERIANYVSAAHWFQAGIRRYHANDRDVAYRLLKKAFNKRDEFVHSTRVEILRYFCLSATRIRKFSESEKCISLLEGDHRTRAIAAFLRGNLYEFKHKYYEAIEWYEKALNLNQGKDRRVEHTYRPLINSILRTAKPDFQKAERYAIEYVRLRHTMFSLMSLARVYLHWKYLGEQAGRNVPDDIDESFNEALNNLANHPGASSAHLQIRAEEAKFNNDFPTALKFIDEAVAAEPRPILRIERWKLMARFGGVEYANQAIRELDAAKSDKEVKDNWLVLLPMLVDVYARALKSAGLPMGAVNQFAGGSLSDDEITQIIRRARSRKGED